MAHLPEIKRDWIVVHGTLLDNTVRGGFEFLGPYTEAEAHRVRASIEDSETHTLAVQLLKHPVPKDPPCPSAT